ncbi:MAG: hypothetical protein V3T98_00760 [Candidatus Paceibacterota bacterium]
MFQPFLDSFSPLLEFIRANLAIFQWLGIFVLLLIIAKLFEQTWLFHRQVRYKNAIDWILLEIRIPREVQKTPMAMEQFFMNLHGLRNAPNNLLEKYVDGEVTMWWSLEMASFGGEIHFYIRTPKKHKKMVEAGLYAQYPYIEVFEVKDYMDEFPKNTGEIYQKGNNVFGSEFVLVKNDVYPITTYEYFEKTKEELAIDPISAFLEALSNIHKEEIVFVQFLIRPVGPEWHEAGRRLIDKLIGRKTQKKGEGGDTLTDTARNVFMAPIEHPAWSGKTEDKKDENLMRRLTPGELDVIKAIERNISKPGFDTIIRFVYYAPNSIFSTNFARRGLLGALNQYASQALNSFRNNFKIETRSRWIYFPHLFVAKRVEARKQRLLHNYRNRKMPEELKLGSAYTSHPLNFNFKSRNLILSTAELATIYHVPAEGVLTAPHTKRAESKKMGPPAGLPIFGSENE